MYQDDKVLKYVKARKIDFDKEAKHQDFFPHGFGPLLCIDTVAIRSDEAFQKRPLHNLFWLRS